MTDLLKSIVSEVLNRNTRESKPEAKPSTNPTSPIEGLHRPNYQRQRQFGNITPGVAASSKKQPTPGVDLSALQKLSTAQLNQTTRGNTSSHSSENGEGAELIGKTSDNQMIWYFPSPSQTLRLVLGRESVGFITGISSYPSTLFIVDELLKGMPDVTWQLFGDKKTSGNLVDTIIIQTKTNRTLHTILKDLINQLNRRAARRICSYKVERPSSNLSRCFNRSDSLSLAILESVPYISSLALMDRYFHQHPRSSLHYDLRDNFLLIAGQFVVVEEAIQLIEQDAVQLLL